MINLSCKRRCSSLCSCQMPIQSHQSLDVRTSRPLFELSFLFIHLIIYLSSHLSCSVVPELVFFTRRHIQDPASQRLTWNTSPKSVLVIKKIRDASLLEPFKELCRFLTEVRSLHPPLPSLSSSRWPMRAALSRWANETNDTSNAQCSTLIHQWRAAIPKSQLTLFQMSFFSFIVINMPPLHVSWEE